MEVKTVSLKAGNNLFKMNLRMPGLIENAIFIRGGWETGLAKQMASFIKEGSTFLDIGANIGYHTLYMASTFPDIQCIAFEPNPNVLEELKENIKVNGYKNISVYDYAVGDSCESIEFYMTGEASLNRGVSAVNLPKYGSGLKKETVNMVALDQFLEEKFKENTSVLKIDAQGYEYQVIRGSLDLIGKSKPVIFLEFHDESEKTPLEIFSLIPEYEVYTIEAWSGEINKYERSDNKCWSDFLCVPPEVAVQ